MWCRFIDWLRKLFGCECKGESDRSKHTLLVGWNTFVYTGFTMNASDHFEKLMHNEKLDAVRWKDSHGFIKELYHSNFPYPHWNNEIGFLKRGRTYHIKVNTTVKGWEF